MGEWIELEDGSRAYRATPSNGQGSGILLLHAWWGLNDTAVSFADAFGEAGFVVIAPDLYRGAVADTIEDAERQSEAQSVVVRMRTVAAALTRLRGEPGVTASSLGVVGFSMGAFYALEATGDDPSIVATVLVYGTGRDRDWSSSNASFQGHFAADDPFESAETVAALESSLRAGGRRTEFHTYPGTGHWFMEPDRADAFDESAAALAWGRTVAFLRAEVD
ncbi:MAG: dienelactone hydrolase family protein [Chloroflexota bacterium]